MIFRRVKAHIEKENWFAVLIDFLIVVVGVFIGIQVANWNAARVDAQSERQYLDRLHEEVVTVLKQRERTDKISNDDNNYLKEVSEVFYGRAEARPLTADECKAVATMHIMPFGANALPTVDELLSSGRLELISVAQVRKEVIGYQQTVMRAAGLVTQMETTVEVLPRRFPELYTRSIRPPRADVVDVKLENECNGAAMLADRVFLSSFADAFDRYDTYVIRAINKVTEQLKRLHAELDIALGIDHETESEQ